MLLFVTPGGRGAHIELGCAFGNHIPVVVLLDEATRPIEFYGLGRVCRFEETAIKVIVNIIN
mgnify:CR=1 FL=1